MANRASNRPLKFTMGCLMDVTVKLATTAMPSSTWMVVSPRDVLCSCEWTVAYTVGTVVRLKGPAVENTRLAGFGEACSVTDAVPESVQRAISASYVLPKGAIRKPSPAAFPPRDK